MGSKVTKSFRNQKIADRLRFFIAERIREQVDPQKAIIGINEVRISPDQKYAKVFWSVTVFNENLENASLYPSQREVDVVSQTISSMSKRIRHQIASELELRHVPELNFVYDATMENATRLDELLDRAKKQSNSTKEDE